MKKLKCLLEILEHWKWITGISSLSVGLFFPQLCVLVRVLQTFWWSLTVCLPPEAAPSASMINAAAYLPSLGSGVPFLLLYPAAPAAGTERTRRGLFLLRFYPLTIQTHHQQGTNQTIKPPQLPTDQTTTAKKSTESKLQLVLQLIIFSIID